MSYPQNPEQFSQPQKSWPARHKALTAIGAVLAAFFVLAVIGAATGSGSASSAAAPAPTVTVVQHDPGPTATVTVTATPRATATTSAPAPAPAKAQAATPAARTVATFSGSGQQNTPKFTVTGTWKLKHSFDCSTFGYKGNFQVYEDGGFAGLTVNDLGTAKSASTFAYDDAGTHYLQVNSECSWTMKVIDEPGQ